MNRLPHLGVGASNSIGLLGWEVNMQERIVSFGVPLGVGSAALPLSAQEMVWEGRAGPAA